MQSAAEDGATRAGFDAVATDYARLVPDLAVEAPLDRAVLAAFVEMVQASGGGLVADVGCGAGRVTAHLADAGLEVLGLDLSRGMVDAARSARGDLPFAVAHAGALPVAAGALAGLVGWYSLVNMASSRLPAVIVEFARVLQPGAPVVLAFQSGDGERVDRTTSYGRPVPLTYYRHRIGDMTSALAAAGFALHATIRREPSGAHESSPQGFVLARLQADGRS